MFEFGEGWNGLGEADGAAPGDHEVSAGLGPAWERPPVIARSGPATTGGSSPVPGSRSLIGALRDPIDERGAPQREVRVGGRIRGARI